MERNPWISMLFILLQLPLHISGTNMKPANVAIHIWEGNVTVTWAPPQSPPLDCLYQVQQSKYESSSPVWTNVSHCNLIKATTCNIGMLPHDEQFKVRVGILTPANSFSWSNSKLINIKMSQLLAPSFSLSSTSHSVQVKVHQNREIYNIFPYGVQYTAYLWPHGQNNQTLMKSNDDDDEVEIEFNLLLSWHTYCVRVKVESCTTDATNVSSDSCIRLLPDPILIICFAFLGVLGSIALLMLFVCFVRHPGKTPAALKPIANGWRPMIVGLDKVETVTDKGWLLITNQTEVKRQTSEKKSAATEDAKERRESLDSGVSMEPPHPSAPNLTADVRMGDTQVDSGCGSLKGTESGGSVEAATKELLSLDERSLHERIQGREDSGLGLGPQGASGGLEGEDIRLLSGIQAGGGYRNQSPASVDMVNESAETYEVDTDMAAPSDGYRSGQVACMCSDCEYCFWCKFKKPVDCQSGIQTQTYFSQSQSGNVDGALGISNYLKKSLIQSVNVVGIEEDTASAQSDMKETQCPASFLSCSLLLQCEENPVTQILPFTLDDVELTSSGTACV